MAQEFQVRRDNSANNVPVVAYNEGSDAQDVILFGAYKTTETLTTNANSQVTTSQPIISVSGRVTRDTDANGYRRGRDYSYDITARTQAGVIYYVGDVDAYNGIITLWSNAQKTVLAPSNTQVIIEYYSRRNIEVDSDGRFTYQIDLSGWEVVNNIDIQAESRRPARWNAIQRNWTGPTTINQTDVMAFQSGYGDSDVYYITKIIPPMAASGAQLIRFWFSIVPKSQTDRTYATLVASSFFLVEITNLGSANNPQQYINGEPRNIIDLGPDGVEYVVNYHDLVVGYSGAVSAQGTTGIVRQTQVLGYYNIGGGEGLG